MEEEILRLDADKQALGVDLENADTSGREGNTRSILDLSEEERRIYCGEVLKMCDIQLERDPNNAFTHSGKGAYLTILKRDEEALECYQQAININPHYAGAYLAKANALYALKRYEEALDAYEEALNADPKKVFA